jgi:hypothetical protein
MISRCTSSFPNEDIFPQLLYSVMRCPHACCWRSQVLPRLSTSLPDLWSELPGALKAHSGALRCSQTYHNHSLVTTVPIIKDSRYFEGRPECPPKVWYSPEIDTSNFTVHILSDTLGGFQWLNYILLMHWPRIGYHKDRKWLGNEERGRGVEIAPNGQGSRLVREVAGEPKPTCYREGISQ